MILKLMKEHLHYNRIFTLFSFRNIEIRLILGSAIEIIFSHWHNYSISESKEWTIPTIDTPIPSAGTDIWYEWLNSIHKESN